MRCLYFLLLNVFLFSLFQYSFAKEDDNLKLAKDSQNPLAKLAVVPIRLNVYPHVTAAAGGSPTTGFPGAKGIRTARTLRKTNVAPGIPRGLYDTSSLPSVDSSSFYSSSSVPPLPPPPFHGTLNTFDINPTLPVTLGERQYLLLRWQQAVSFAENVYEYHGLNNGFGDANPSMDYAYAFTDDLLLGLGIALVVPTATDPFLGQGKWSGGPSITGVWSPGKFVVGGIAQNIFSFGGPRGRPAVNIMTFQPLINYNFDHGWYLTSNPYIIANWNNPPRDKWTIPVGGGVGKLFKIGEQPMTFSVTAYWYPVKPIGAPNYSWRFTLQYLFPQEDEKKKKGSK